MKKTTSKKLKVRVIKKATSSPKSGTKKKVLSKASVKSPSTQFKSDLTSSRKRKSRVLATKKTQKSKLDRQAQTQSKGPEKKDSEKVTRSRIEINQRVRAQVLKHFESGVKLIYKLEFEKARDIFKKVNRLNGKDKAISERVKTYLQLCEQKLEQQRGSSPQNDEERYNLAVVLMNNGRYQDSINHLNKILKKNPKCDYVVYALAVSMCQLGDDENSLSNLKEAIRLKSENRFLAQRDSDFEPLLNDSRFLSLVFPEEPVDEQS